MALPLRDFADRMVPVLSSVVPLERWVLSDAKYQARLATLQAAMRRPAAYDLVVLGDSHSQYIEGHRSLSGLAVLNLGIARDTSVGIAGRLGSISDQINAANVLIEVGYNDLKYRGVPAIAANIGRIVAAIETRRLGNGRVILQGLFPVESGRVFTNNQIHDLNGKLQTICRSAECVYLDVMRSFSGSDGGLDARYSKDGVHLNDSGNCRWIGLLLTVLKRRV